MYGPKIGVLIYTYDRVDDAKINMEIVRSEWDRNPLIGKAIIVHAYNGRREWYARQYLEDRLVRTDGNPGHFRGAAELIDAGMSSFSSAYPEVEYVVVLASDTWLIRPDYLASMVETMYQKELRLASCAWGLPDRNDPFVVGLATDFFIVDHAWARNYQMFPIVDSDFKARHSVERLVLSRFLEAVSREREGKADTGEIELSSLLRITDREPVHSEIDRDGSWRREHYWPTMGLLTHHDPAEKRRILRQFSLRGRYIETFCK